MVSIQKRSRRSLIESEARSAGWTRRGVTGYQTSPGNHGNQADRPAFTLPHHDSYITRGHAKIKTNKPEVMTDMYNKTTVGAIRLVFQRSTRTDRGAFGLEFLEKYNSSFVFDG